jgi:hypothetical protein
LIEWGEKAVHLQNLSGSTARGRELDPTQGIAQRLLQLRDALRPESTRSFLQRRLGNRAQIVEIGNAATRQAFAWPKDYFLRDTTHMTRYFDSQDASQVGVRRISR